MTDNSFVSNPYKKEDKKSLAEVIISQIDVCRKEFSKELKKGFEKQIVVEGRVVTVNVPDQRHTNIQCTKTLHDLLMFYFDSVFKEKLKEINLKINSNNKPFLERYLLIETDTRLKQIAKRTSMIQNSNAGENIFQQMMNYKSELHREMFQELVLLFKRKNELSGKRTLSWDD